MNDCYIDLHLHLDGAITPGIARRLAVMQNIALPDENRLKTLLSVPASCRSLNDFLNCFALPLSLLQTKEALKEAVRLVMDEIRAQGVIYAEIRFAPQLHTEQGLSQRQAVQAALDGLFTSQLPGNLILCLMRGADYEKNLETVELAAEFLPALTGTGHVAALDLAGAEALFPTEDYAALFARARALGVPFTIHAGEAAGPDSIRAAIEMGAARIGHGVRLFEDPDLLVLVQKRQIPLELCPTSNRQTCALPENTPYPLRQYLDAGLLVTLNTDDMAISRTSIAAEFDAMEAECGLTASERRLLLKNAANSAFAGAQLKAWMAAQID